MVELPTGKRAVLQQLLAKEQGEGYNIAEALRRRLEKYGAGHTGFVGMHVVNYLVPQCGSSTADHHCDLPQPDHKRQRGCGAPVLAVIKQYMHQHVQGRHRLDGTAMHPYPCAHQAIVKPLGIGQKRQHRVLLKNITGCIAPVRMC